MSEEEVDVKKLRQENADMYSSLLTIKMSHDKSPCIAVDIAQDTLDRIRLGPDYEPRISCGPGWICPNCHDDHGMDRVCPEFQTQRELLEKAAKVIQTESAALLMRGFDCRSEAMKEWLGEYGKLEGE